jgi:hypothetical protein
MPTLKEFEMSVRKMPLFMPVLFVVLVPLGASAGGVVHNTTSEIGYASYPSHAVAGKSRAQIEAEIEAARKDGSLAILQRGMPLPFKPTGAGPTREQVRTEAELLNKAYLLPRGEM